MAELIPVPFSRLIRTMFTSLSERGAIFDVPKSKFYRTPDGMDYGVAFHGHRAATPFGPAAGPHAQMAQNIVMAWLTGSRILEMKTVQINDALEIPRPCIDVPNLGFNIEWSQELKIPDSLEEYVKGSMLIDMLVHSSNLHGGDETALQLSPGDGDTIFDMSVGYDLAGIRGEKVSAFIEGMRDASAIVERLRHEIDGPWAHLKDIPFRTCISDTITLSTFHGCPPEEVEAIGTYLIEELGVHTIIKLNPTLLGPKRLRSILNDHLGYDELHVPDHAFTDDMQWDQAEGILSRLKQRADKAGVGFGAKFTNTLIVENHRDVFAKTEKVMYLSGAPLHALSMTLAADFREKFGDQLQYSFSAGIDANNFVDAICCGLTPVTACTDLLKKGGYARSHKYFKNLAKVMKAEAVTNLHDLIVARSPDPAAALKVALPDAEQQTAVTALMAGPATERLGATAALGQVLGAETSSTMAAWQEAAATATLSAYRERLATTNTYSKAKLAKPPRKPGTELWMFDCLTCDICVPVCPNDANFTYVLDVPEVPVEKAVKTDEGWEWLASEAIAANKKHQIGNFADLCNECGNCDTFCPDHGGPYLLKPRFFGSLEQWQLWSKHDGFFVSRGDGADLGAVGRVGDTAFGRFEGRSFSSVLRADGRFDFDHEGTALVVDLETLSIDSDLEPGTQVDLTYLRLLNTMRRAILALPGHYLSV
ncbi:MAG: 4Fe-4S dicluster domain-containing protein [Myxococcales bacterium]|nr:4Fe-4S dicluster domain-containing protein [Myxococcales bacterium]